MHKHFLWGHLSSSQPLTITTPHPFTSQFFPMYWHKGCKEKVKSVEPMSDPINSQRVRPYLYTQWAHNVTRIQAVLSNGAKIRLITNLFRLGL